MLYSKLLSAAELPLIPTQPGTQIKTISPKYSSWILFENRRVIFHVTHNYNLKWWQWIKEQENSSFNLSGSGMTSVHIPKKSKEDSHKLCNEHRAVAGMMLWVRFAATPPSDSEPSRLAHTDLAKKKKNCMNFYSFVRNYYVALISALVLLKCGNLRITVVV